MIYRMEVDAWSDALGAVVRRYYSTHADTTGPFDTPAFTTFEGRIINPGNFSWSLYGPGSLLGPSRASGGIAELNNADGGLTGLFDAVDGRRFVLYRSEDRNATYPDDWQLVLNWTMERRERPPGLIRLIIRDRLSEVLKRPLTKQEYDGSNILPDGVEGGPEDLEGKKKPVCYGLCRGVTAIDVNRSKYTRQVATANAGPQTFEIFDVSTQGAVITPGTSHASLVALQDATVAGEEVDSYDGEVSDGAYFRTGSAVKNVTVDVAEGATDADRTAAQIIKRVALGPGELTESDLDDDSFTALDGEFPHICGIWIGTKEATVGDVIIPIAKSGGIYFLPGRDGIFRVGRIKEPTGIADGELTIPEALATKTPIKIFDDVDANLKLPPRRVGVQYKRNYTVLDTSVIADSIEEDDDKLAFLLNELRSVSVSDESRLTRNPSAPELIVETYLDSRAAALAEAARWQDLISPGTATLQIDLHIDHYPTVTKDGVTRLAGPNDVLCVTYPGEGLEDGVNLVLKGAEEDHRRKTAKLEFRGKI